MLKTATTWETANGPVGYERAVATMQGRIAAIRAGGAPEQIWLVEHPPLYTAGTSAKPGDLLDTGRFPTFDAGRGGQWTYHGPGQRVGYVMLDLAEPHGIIPARDIRAFVAGLESWIIAVLAEFGIKGEIRDGRIGIWVKTGATEAKIGAIGVRITRWVSWHGFSLNVNPDLTHYAGITPCGIQDYGVTSMAALGVSATMADIDAALQRNFRTIFE